MVQEDHYIINFSVLSWLLLLFLAAVESEKSWNCFSSRYVAIYDFLNYVSDFLYRAVPCSCSLWEAALTQIRKLYALVFKSILTGMKLWLLFVSFGWGKQPPARIDKVVANARLKLEMFQKNTQLQSEAKQLTVLSLCWIFSMFFPFPINHSRVSSFQWSDTDTLW